jgi:hypothetical protein
MFSQSLDLVSPWLGLKSVIRSIPGPHLNESAPTDP